MGTHSPQHVADLVMMARPRTVVDAPVSGSVDAAEAASLLVLAGADAATLEPVRPVLEAIGAEIVALGRPGAGAAMKLAVNLVIHGLNQSVAEALLLADRLGIPPATAMDVLQRSAAGAPMLSYRRPQYVDDRSSPVTFAMDLAAKDLGLVVDLVERLDLSLPQTDVNHAELVAACAAGLGRRDMAALATHLRERS
ncbi:MAG: NAD(P)-dependent oxidoreductase [Acidimicrobiia bacterium]